MLGPNGATAASARGTSRGSGGHVAGGAGIAVVGGAGGACHVVQEAQSKLAKPTAKASPLHDLFQQGRIGGVSLGTDFPLQFLDGGNGIRTEPLEIAAGWIQRLVEEGLRVEVRSVDEDGSSLVQTSWNDLNEGIGCAPQKTNETG